jgi:putative ABC transport system permease protein
MIRNYIKTAWRNLLKNKFYSVINIAGLTLGLAIGIMILLWVQDELSFDGFHKKSDDIYRLELFGGTGASRQIFTVGVAPIGLLAKQELPDVKESVRMTGNGNFAMYKYQDKSFGDLFAAFADPSLFSVFDFPLIKGNTAKPFAGDNSVIITQRTAHKFFGDADPIGKVIVADDKTNFTVSGIINDFPKNSSINADMIMPMSYHIKSMLANGLDLSNNFSNFSYDIYLQLKPNADLKRLTTQIRQIHLNHKPDDTDAEYLLLPLKKMHLYNADLTDKGIETIRIFIVIAILILVIACINYVNLSTARSMLRSKEISMRKIVGAGKTQLFLQFIIETTLLFSLAAMLAFGLIFLLLPVFNNLSGKELIINLIDYHIWTTLLVTILGTLALSSIYPALLLSSFEPLKTLKGKIAIGIGDVMFRKILVVTQFTVSVILIVGTIVITRQLNYIKAKNLGYDKTHVFSVRMREMGSHYDAVKAELLKNPAITGVTRSNQNIVKFYGFTGNVDWDGKDPKQNLFMHPIVVDKDFVSFFKMKIVQGKMFTGAITDTAHFVLNETAIKEMGMTNPVGKWFRMGKTKGQIIGIVKDFHYASMKEKIAPAAFTYDPNNFGTLYIKTTAGDAPKAIAAIQAEYKHYNGEIPFAYNFLDEVFNSLYKSEQREGALFNYFSMIAIFISCLGLLGLAAFTAQVRTREIGVRKVLGASVGSVITLLAVDFVKLVLIAIVVATPIAWYAMNKWLQAFAYKIPIGYMVFVFAGFIAVLIAFMTISVQSVKAALANPVKSLRSE